MLLNSRLSVARSLAMALLLSTSAFAGGDFDKPDVAKPVRITRSPEPTFKIESGIDGDVFPAFANYASLQSPDQRKWGVVSITASNPTDTDRSEEDHV